MDGKQLSWFLLLVGGLFEVGFTFCLGKTKMSMGNFNTFWFLGFVICLLGSIIFLYKATQTLPIGTAYAVWTGIGAVGTVLLGILVFKEPASFWRLFFLSTLIISLVGLKIVGV